jgi:hypothetical protein
MSTYKRMLLFFILPIISPLLLPLIWRADAWLGILVEVILFLALGYALMRGSSTALTLSIFLQGLNVIVRLMMFFPHAAPAVGVYNWAYILSSFASIGLSMYLLLRLDKVDVRVQMTH